MNPLSAQRLAELLASYGADPARWPPEALALVPVERSGPEWDRARAVDALLGALAPVPSPSPGLRRTVLRAVADEPRGGMRALQALWRALGGLRIAAPALAAALLLGVGVGWTTLPAEPDFPGDAGEDLLALALLDERYPEIDP